MTATYAVRISDRDGSHYHSDLFDSLALAGAFAIHNSIGRDCGAEVVAVTPGSSKGRRVAEFAEGSQIETIECDVPVTGRMADKLEAMTA